MKTAMQELIEDLENQISGFTNEFIGVKNQLIIVKNNAIKKLEKEKEQIINAHILGFDNIVAEHKKEEFANEYFDRTFNQNN